MCLETGKLISRGHISGTKKNVSEPRDKSPGGRGGGGTAIYGLYRYVTL